MAVSFDPPEAQLKSASALGYCSRSFIALLTVCLFSLYRTKLPIWLRYKNPYH